MLCSVLECLEDIPELKVLEQKPKNEHLIRHMLHNWDPVQLGGANALITGTPAISATTFFNNLRQAAKEGRAREYVQSPEFWVSYIYILCC